MQKVGGGQGGALKGGGGVRHLLRGASSAPPCAKPGLKLRAELGNPVVNHAGSEISFASLLGMFLQHEFNIMGCLQKPTLVENLLSATNTCARDSERSYEDIYCQANIFGPYLYNKFTKSGPPLLILSLTENLKCQQLTNSGGNRDLFYKSNERILNVVGFGQLPCFVFLNLEILKQKMSFKQFYKFCNLHICAASIT